MNAEQSLKRPYSQIDADVDPQDRVETDAEESSKRLCFDKMSLLDPRHFHHMHYTTSPYKAIGPSTNRKPTSCDDDSIRSAPNAKRPQNLNYDPKRLLDPKAFLAGFLQHSTSKPFPPSLLDLNHSTKSNSIAPLPLRPTFAHPAADGQQGMKVLFLIDHATKGDAIHHAIGAYVHPDSSEMVLLMRKYLSDRSSFQNQFFAKARRICAQFTSRLECLGKLSKPGNKSGRLMYLRTAGRQGRAWLS